jgi:hypothetical protein
MSMDMAGDLVTACADWERAVELGDKNSTQFISKNCS